ncbi:hypothetical protein SAMN05660964_03813 [Thiothrix caldifontis]|uniref:Uncharacterized protein n=1 Tax=Thiothrix caldifontis TaxID=525918 RepID=A0A1H4GYH4_9GAMM|nr:hypothetical protein SAMN05660964_03813 [Thiothrix caldifontis]
MNRRVSYFKHTEFHFVTIDDVKYVSLRSLRLKERPEEGEVFQTFELTATGCNPFEIIRITSAINLIKDESLKEYLQGALLQ